MLRDGQGTTDDVARYSRSSGSGFVQGVVRRLTTSDADRQKVTIIDSSIAKVINVSTERVYQITLSYTPFRARYELFQPDSAAAVGTAGVESRVCLHDTFCVDPYP